MTVDADKGLDAEEEEKEERQPSLLKEDSNVLTLTLGSAAFRSQLLARYSTVVTITYNLDSSTAESNGR